jgi:predicted phosphate transport protein (TIGR00153 family)
MAADILPATAITEEFASEPMRGVQTSPCRWDEKAEEVHMCHGLYGEVCGGRLTCLKLARQVHNLAGWRTQMSTNPRRTSSPSGGRIRRLLGKNVRALSFIPRERRFYDLFEQQAAVIVRSAGLLEQALADVANLPVRQREIKDLEHQGDEITREIVLTLNRIFVTPFDHEDIYALASGLDDILDYIEEVADTANLYGITTIPQHARELASLLARAVAQLEQAIGKLESGKGIDEHSAEVHRLEDVGDSTSRRAIAELFHNQYPPLEVIKLKDLYGLLEDALDRCETVANVLEGITTKNA